MISRLVLDFYYFVLIIFDGQDIIISLGCMIFIGGLIGVNVIGREGYTSHEVIPILIVTHISHNFLCLNFAYSAR